MKLRRSLGQHLGRVSRRLQADSPWVFPTARNAPNSIIDVGAARGTPPLYQAFRHAEILAIDPQADELDALPARYPDRSFELANVALGRAPAVVNLHIDTQKPTRSSLFKRTPLTRTDSPIASRRVRVDTLDRVVSRSRVSPPHVLKIDTEGSEYDILLGAERVLEDVEFLVCEVSIARRFTDGYQFEDIVTLLASSGLTIANVLNVAWSRGGQALHADVLWQRS